MPVLAHGFPLDIVLPGAKALLQLNLHDGIVFGKEKSDFFDTFSPAGPKTSIFENIRSIALPNTMVTFSGGSASRTLIASPSRVSRTSFMDAPAGLGYTRKKGSHVYLRV
jgi:hypothetical protein